MYIPIINQHMNIMVETLITGYSYQLRFKVIQRLHELESTKQLLQDQLDSLLKQYTVLDTKLSEAVRFLCMGGKQLRPIYKVDINALIQKIQSDLFDSEDYEGA